jgi:hypothetical protein
LGISSVSTTGGGKSNSISCEGGANGRMPAGVDDLIPDLSAPWTTDLPPDEKVFSFAERTRLNRQLTFDPSLSATTPFFSQLRSYAAFKSRRH